VLTQDFRNVGLIAAWKHDHVRFIFQRNGRGPNWREVQELRRQQANRRRRMLDMPTMEGPSSELKQVLWDEGRSSLLSAKADVDQVKWGWHSKVYVTNLPGRLLQKNRVAFVSMVGDTSGATIVLARVGAGLLSTLVVRGVMASPPAIGNLA